MGRHLAIVPKASNALKKWSSNITAAWQKTVESIIETGRLLNEAKDDLDHGEWMEMVEKHLPFGQSTTNKLMAIVKNAVLSNSEFIPNLPASWGVLYECDKLPEQQLRLAIKKGDINPRTTKKDVVAMRELKPTSKKKAKKSQTSVPAKVDKAGISIITECENALIKALHGSKRSVIGDSILRILDQTHTPVQYISSRDWKRVRASGVLHHFYVGSDMSDADDMIVGPREDTNVNT